VNGNGTNLTIIKAKFFGDNLFKSHYKFNISTRCYKKFDRERNEEKI